MTSVTKIWAFALVILTTLLTTTAQFFLKTSVGLLPKLTISLLAGVALYAFGSVVMILAFKGGEVSVLYPLIATSYIWVALVARFLLHEEVHVLRWIGIVVIVAGISIIGVASKSGAGIAHGAA